MDENKIVSEFLDLLFNDMQKHPLNDILKGNNLESPNHFLKQKEFNFYDLILEMNLNESINFYPGIQTNSCYETAFFVSFRKEPLNFKMPKSNFVSLDIILKVMVQKVLGDCYDINKNIILLTDNINVQKQEEWLGNLKTIKKLCKSFNVYYVFPDGKHENANRFFGI